MGLNIKITDWLRLEGWARDIVRHMQQRRKEVGLEIQNHIQVDWNSDDEVICAAINEHCDYICSETLCEKLSNSDTVFDNNHKKIKLGDGFLVFTIMKFN